MSTSYDSEKIRQLARQIGQTAQAVDDVNSELFKPMIQERSSNFTGQAGTALEETVSELMRQVNSTAGQLAGIQRSLNRLADQVEQADRQAKAQIERN